MRADMTPEQVRAAGIYLNGGRRRGWKRRLSALIDTPQATISAWSTRSAGNARPIPGVAAVAIKLLVAMMRQELMVTAQPGRAGEAMSERLMALLGQPQPLAGDDRPITVENLSRPVSSVQPTGLLGIRRPGQVAEPRAPTASERDPPDSPIPLGIEEPGARSSRSGRSA
jgi:hypothetical protein